MYDFMRKELYGPYMTNNASATVCNCRSCAQDRKQGKLQGLLKLFFPKGSLQFVGMDILGPPPKTEKGTRFVVVMTECYTKLRRFRP